MTAEVTELRPLARGYTREQAVAAEIAALRRQPAEAFWRRVTSRDGAAAPPECLIYLAREFRMRGDERAAWRVIEALEKRVAATVMRALVRLPFMSRDQREELLDSLVCALYEAWLSEDPAHAFWEVRFNLCLKRAIIDAVKRFRRAAENEVSPGQWTDEEDSPGDPMERVVDSGALDPQTWAVARMSLAALPEPLRTAFYLRHFEDWPEESGDPNQPSIARYLNVTGRSVRNYLRRAEALLAESQAAPQRSEMH